jgi:ABC-type transport system involved in cytochrome c biogenesis permease subunit
VAVKTDLLGYLIYCGLAAHVYAAVALVLRPSTGSLRSEHSGSRTGRPELVEGRRRVFGQVAFLTGFGVTAAAWVVRWVQVGHVPLQSLFEVFLTLGMLVYPLSLLARRLGAAGVAAHALLAAAVLLPAGFVFSAARWPLPAVLRSALFVPHVATYLLAYVVLMMAAVESLLQLAARAGSGRAVACERATWRLACLGFPPLTAGLVLGIIWAKSAWGGYWHWDPKETWSLVTWLIFLGYFPLRLATAKRWPRVGAVAVLAGAAAILMTLLWVNLTGSSPLHSHAF